MSAAPRRRDPRRLALAPAIAVAALSAAVNIWHALEYPFWQDEVAAARVITTEGPIQMLRTIASTELHPPGFYTAGWLLDRVGVSVAWDRAISILAAMALSGFLVVYARRFVPLWGAALAGLVSVLGWQFWRHGWELRPYALFALTCFLFVVVLERAADRPTRGRLALLGAVAAVGVMTHYFFVFTLVGGLIWIVIGKRPRALLAALGLGLVPLVAWLPGVYKQYERHGFKWIGPFRARAVLDIFADLFDRSPPGGAWGLLVAVPLFFLVLAGALRLWRTSDAGRLCALSAVVPVAAAAVAWLVGPEVFLARNLIGAAPFAVVALAAAIAALPRPLAVAGTALAAALMVATFANSQGRVVPPYDRVADALVREGWREQDPILLFGPPNQFLHTLDWYLPGRKRLEFATWTGGACDRVFVVSVAGRGRALTASAPNQRVKRVVIARLPYRSSFGDEVRRRDGRVLGTRAVACARVD